MKLTKNFKVLARAATVSCALLFPAIVAPQEVIVGLGATDYPDRGNDSEIVSLEYIHSPFFKSDNFSAAFAANGSITSDSDWYIGAGLAMRWSWHSGWFADGSLLAGYYKVGIPGNDLGNDLEFRSLLAVGYELDSGSRLSLAITHKSNASISDVNPGVDTLLLRYHLPLGIRAIE